MSTNPNDLKMSEFPLAGPIDLLTDYVAIVRVVAGVPANLLAAVTDIQLANVPPAGGGGGGAVDSVFGRTGNVLAQGGDYTWGQIAGTTLPIVSGVNVTNLNASALAVGTVPDAVLADVIAPGTFTSASITVDAKGRVTAAASGPPKAQPNTTIGVIPYLSAPAVYSDSPLIREDANTITLRSGAPTALKMYKATVADPGKYLLIDNRNDAGGTPRWIIQGTANQFNGWDNVAIGSGGNSNVFGDGTMYPVVNGGVPTSVGIATARYATFYAANWLDIRQGSSFDWTGVKWNGSSRIISYANGTVSIDGNNDNTAGARLLFGTQVATAPALKRNAAGLDARLADDSGYAAFAAAAVRVANSGTVYADLTMSAGPGGILTIASTGSINFQTVGNQIDPAVGYEENLGSLQKKYLGVYAAELWVETLVAQDTIATIGGRVLVGPTTTLTADVAPADTTINVKHNQISVGDVLVMQVAGKVEFMVATAGPTQPGGAGTPYVYTVTRNLDGTGADQWFAGDAVFNTGQVGNGFIDLYSIFALKGATQSGPTIVGNVRNSPTYNDWSEHWAIGNLKGVYGYGATTYGVGLGKYAAGTAHVTIDATAGLRMFSGLATVVGQWQNNGTITLGSPIRIQLNPDGSGFLANSAISWDTAGNLTITSSATIGGWTIAANKIYSTGVNLNSGTNAGLAFGTTPPTSTTPGAPTGTGIWLDRTGLYALAASVVQVKIDATTGQFIAGTNQVVIDNTGITIQQPSAGVSCFRISDAGVKGFEIRGSLGVIVLQAFGNAANGISGGGNVNITAINSSQTQQIYLNLVNDMANNRSVAVLYSPVGTFGGFCVGETGAAPAASAVLDLQTTHGALLLSRLTSAQRDALTPTNGMMLFNTDAQRVQVRLSSTWQSLAIPQLTASMALGTPYGPPNSVWQNVPYDTVTNDLSGMRGGPAGGLVCLLAGTYLCVLAMVYPPTTGGNQVGLFGFAKNGAYSAPFANGSTPAGVATNTPVTFTATVALVAGDYVNVVVGNYNGGVTIPIGATWSMSKIG
jgi:hypothetical protein